MEQIIGNGEYLIFKFEEHTEQWKRKKNEQKYYSDSQFYPLKIKGESIQIFFDGLWETWAIQVQYCITGAKIITPQCLIPSVFRINCNQKYGFEGKAIATTLHFLLT